MGVHSGDDTKATRAGRHPGQPFAEGRPLTSRHIVP